jgi:hypothetical protein
MDELQPIVSFHDNGGIPHDGNNFPSLRGSPAPVQTRLSDSVDHSVPESRKDGQSKSKKRSRKVSQAKPKKPLSVSQNLWWLLWSLDMYPQDLLTAIHDTLVFRLTTSSSNTVEREFLLRTQMTTFATTTMV